MTGRALRAVPSAAAGGDTAGIDDLLALWSMWMRATGSADKTISTRLEGVRVLGAHAGAHPAELDTMDVVAWLASCRSQWTRRTYSSSARAWYAWLVEQGLRDDNPMTRIPKQAQPRSHPRPAPDQALRDVLASRHMGTTRAYLLLGAYQGLRAGEIGRVRGQDFDGDWLSVRGKGDTRATIPVHPLVAPLRGSFPAFGYWFPGRDGGHVSGKVVSATVSAAFTRAGHPEVTCHMLRHWYGTQLQRATGDLRVTQELMRHASIQSTAIYTQVSTRSKVDAVRRVGTVS